MRVPAGYNREESSRPARREFLNIAAPMILRRFLLPALALAGALALPAQTPDQIAAGQAALKRALTCRQPVAALEEELTRIGGFTPAVLKDTLAFYGRELERKRKLDGERARYAPGDAPVKGPANAPVTILEFSDFECPACGKAHPWVMRFMREYAGKVRLAHKCWALPMHNYSAPACAAARAAGAQNKYFEMHDWIFTRQEQLASLAGSDFGPAAIALGLDWNRFKADYARFKADTAFGAAITAEAGALGVGSTPTFFINGEKVEGARDYAPLKEKIEAALAEQNCAPAPAAKPAPAPARKPAPRPAPKPAG